MRAATHPALPALVMSSADCSSVCRSRIPAAVTTHAPSRPPPRFSSMRSMPTGGGARRQCLRRPALSRRPHGDRCPGPAHAATVLAERASGQHTEPRALPVARPVTVVCGVAWSRCCCRGCQGKTSPTRRTLHALAPNLTARGAQPPVALRSGIRSVVGRAPSRRWEAPAPGSRPWHCTWPGCSRRCHSPATEPPSSLAGNTAQLHRRWCRRSVLACKSTAAPPPRAAVPTA